ncbi:unnamed protein product, partial [Vitis vinifera]
MCLLQSKPIPVSSRYAANANASADANALIPWLKNLSSGSSSTSSKFPHHLYIHGGSISAPVTPPLSSPTARTPRLKNDWDDTTGGPASPTFSLVSANPFGFKEEVLAGGGSRMWTPGQSGTCSPAVAAGSDHTADVPMADGIAADSPLGALEPDKRTEGKLTLGLMVWL